MSTDASQTPDALDPAEALRLARRRRLAGQLTERLIWWPLLAAIAFAWFLFGSRLVRSLGPDALAPGAGVMLAAAVALTLWRWSVRDARRETVEAGTCPRCSALLESFEFTPRPGALAHGLHGWRCPNCGLEEARPLTARNSGP